MGAQLSLVRARAGCTRALRLARIGAAARPTADAGGCPRRRPRLARRRRWRRSSCRSPAAS
jgi:hypothetical protein